MKKITLLILFITTTFTYGQNLATNGDAESSGTLSATFIENGWHLRSGQTLNPSLYTSGGAYANGNNSILHPDGTGDPDNFTSTSRFGLRDFLDGDDLIVTGVTYQVSLLGIHDSGTANKGINITYKDAGNNTLVALDEIPAPPKPTNSGWLNIRGTFEAADGDGSPQYLDFKFGKGLIGNVYFDDLELKILACNDENIEVVENETSTKSIYDDDINNGSEITITTNANVSVVNFYEADGTTDANAKFTLNADGTITSTGGTLGNDYKVAYTLTSTSDADTSGSNDYDSIVQTFSVTTPPPPEKLDYTFDTPGDTEGWIDDNIDGAYGAATTVVGGELVITFPNPPVEGDKSFINQSLYSVNPQNADYVYIRYKNNSDNETMKFAITNSDGEIAKYVMTSPNGNGIPTNTTEFQVLQIDLTKKSDLTEEVKWTNFTYADNFEILLRDEVTFLNSDNIPDTSSSGTFVIDRIIFSSETTYAAATLGVENITKEDASITLYPNPVSNILSIRATNRIEKVEIFNLLGQKVLTENSDRIDVSKLNKGIYISKIYQEGDIVSTKRFIKQ